MRIGKKQERVLLFLKDKDNIELNDIISNIEDSKEFDRVIYETYRRAIKTLYKNDLVKIIKKGRKNYYTLSKRGIRHTQKIIRDIKEKQNQLRETFKLIENYKYFKKDKQELDYSEIERGIELLPSQQCLQIKRFRNSIPKFYTCTECSLPKNPKTHNIHSKIGKKHEKFKDTYKPINEMKEIYKKYKEGSINPAQAVKNILDWCYSFKQDTAIKYEMIDEYEIYKKGINYLISINPRVNGVFEFIENLLFNNIVDQKSVLNIIDEYYPAKLKSVKELLNN